MYKPKAYSFAKKKPNRKMKQEIRCFKGHRQPKLHYEADENHAIFTRLKTKQRRFQP